MMKMMNYLTAFAATALLLGSCTKGLGWDEEQNGGGQNQPNIPVEGELVLSADKLEIEGDGEDFAQLKVTKGDVEVPANLYKVYEEIDGKSERIECTDGQYKSEKLGPHIIKVLYGTEASNVIEIRVKKPSGGGGDVPGPVNPGGEGTNFKRRVLMIQFTGTNCGYCPYMINTLNAMMEDSNISENSILVAAHRYNANDPAFMSQALNDALSVTGYPTLNFDMYTNSQQYNSVNYNTTLFTQCLSRVEVRGGIAANSVYNSETKQVTIAAQVKAAVESEFRIGAMLIEDQIVGTQANYGAPGNWTNFVHNNNIRYVDGQHATADYTGHDLGTIAAGATADYTFTIDIKSGWKVENCRLVLYITTPEVIGNSRKFYVNNAIAMPLTGEKSYEYKE